MKNLLIIGARATGRGIYGFRHDFVGYNEPFVIKGFLDDDKNVLDGFDGYPPILSSVEDYEVQKDDVFICALGDPVYKQKYVDMILRKKGEFISLISKNLVLSERNKRVGKGCLILAYCVIDADSIIGDHVTMLTHVAIGHDSVVEDFCALDIQTTVCGNCHLKKGALLSTGAKVMPHKTVGEYAVVNSGSVVAKDVPDGAKVMGIPARESKSWLRMVMQKIK